MLHKICGWLNPLPFSNIHSKVPNITLSITGFMAFEDEPFTFEVIAQVYREERKSKTLTILPMHFYKELAKYTNELRKSYFKERSKDPISSKTMMLEDEYIKAQKRTSQIYEHRERKIVLLALATANGREPNINSLTKEEKKALNEIVNILSKNRINIMLEKETDTCESKTFLTSDKNQSSISKDVETQEISIENYETQNKTKENEESESDEGISENPVLLILEDIPSFETDKRSYNLKKGDAISLSKDVAKILCKHKMARVIKGH
jgi:DNA replication initiation complex subunit (GINS family)